MSDLSDRVRQALAFDELAVEDAALAAGCVKITAGKPGTHHMDSEYFDEGAKFERARTSRLDAATADAIEALEKLLKYPNVDRALTDSPAREALTRIELALEGK